MTFLYIIAVGVLSVGLFHLVAGWALANALHEAALAVKDRPADAGVWVRELKNGRATLEAKTPRQDIGHPGSLGARWDSGYGHLGDVIDVIGSRFVRPFELVDGDPPSVCGGFDCEPIEIDAWYHPFDPSDVGLEFETIEYSTDLGLMTAWYLPANSQRWVVMVHGWTAEKREFLRMLPTFQAAGLNALVLNYRNDEGMPPDPGRLHRFGLTEWAEVAAALEYARARGGREFVLFGCSTGAALVLRCLERERPDDVVALVLDAPNIDLADTVRHSTRDMRATPLMREFGMWLADIRWKVDWEATNFVARSTSIITVPTLVFHGTADPTVPIAMSRSLAARVPHLVELVETPAAGHVMSWNADPRRYEEYLERFLNRI